MIIRVPSTRARNPASRAKPPRVIDYVSLDKLFSDVDLRRGLTGDTNAAVDQREQGGGAGARHRRWHLIRSAAAG
jgi:hypothetical protein